jgi:geranylgeranyl pyrophosphate synthase
MLKEFLSQVRDQVSTNIKKSIGKTNPIEIAMSYSALSESKMIRAGLIFASGKINGGISNNSLITLASAIELIHTYSLIHDDLPCMDDDDFRRGKESCHIKFGEANAVLAGDALQTLAYEMVCNDVDLDPDEKINAIKLISSACGKNGMVYGQFLDIENESKEINKEAIENIHSLKTGKLIECSVMLGQIGNNITQQNEILLKFSKKIGLAFQITDDILEVTSDEKTLGKNINSDRKNKKSTYINVLGIDEAIKRSKELSKSAILDISILKLKEADMLIELAKYISYRER